MNELNTEGDRTPQVLSFRAIIVMTQHDGLSPTLKSVEDALRRANLKFVMPAEYGGSIVIALNDIQ